MVPFLITGPFLPDLLLSSLSLWFLYYVFRNKIFYIFKNNFFYLFLTFCLVCIFSSLMSDNILLSFESSLFYFRIGIFGLLISYMIDKDKKFLNYFFYSLIITFSLTIFYAFIIYILKLNPHPVRVSSFFGDELILGSYLSRLLPLIIALFLIRKNKSYLEKNLFIIFVALTYVAVILSGERAAFFYLNLSLLFIAVFININFKLFLSIIIVFFTSFFILLLSLDNNRTGRLLFERYTASVLINMNLDTVNNKLHSYFKNDKKKLKKLKTNETNETSEPKSKKIVMFTLGHESLYRTAFNMFIDRPIIGHGPKMFRVKCSDPKYSEGVSPCMTHPHNFYIQLLAETGVIGFLFLFFLLVYVISLSIKYFYYYFIKKKKLYSNYQICLLACLLITIWPIIPNGNFFNNHLMILYSLPLGFFKNLNPEI
jgi:O-antigen ligase